MVQIACVYLALRWWEELANDGGDGRLLLAWYLMCLCIGIHLGTFLVAPAVVLLALLVNPRSLFSSKFLTGAVVLLVGRHLGALLPDDPRLAEPGHQRGRPRDLGRHDVPAAAQAVRVAPDVPALGRPVDVPDPDVLGLLHGPVPPVEGRARLPGGAAAGAGPVRRGDAVRAREEDVPHDARPLRHHQLRPDHVPQLHRPRGARPRLLLHLGVPVLRHLDRHGGGLRARAGPRRAGRRARRPPRRSAGAAAPAAQRVHRGCRRGLACVGISWLPAKTYWYTHDRANFTVARDYA